MDKLSALPMLLGMTAFVKDRVSIGGIIQSLVVTAVISGVSVGVGMYVTQSVLRTEFVSIKAEIESVKRELSEIRKDFYRPVFERGGGQR